MVGHSSGFDFDASELNPVIHRSFFMAMSSGLMTNANLTVAQENDVPEHRSGRRHQDARLCLTRSDSCRDP